MTLRPIPIPSVTGGVTEQPAAVALPDRVKSSRNFLPWAEYGLTKRPGFDWKTEVFAVPAPDVVMASIDLRPSERYAIILSNQNVKAFDTDGNSVLVTGLVRNAAGVPTGTAPVDFAYLDLRRPSLIRTSTVGPGEDSGEAFQGGEPAWGLNGIPVAGVTNAVVSSISSEPSPLGWESAPQEIPSFEGNFANLFMSPSGSATGSYDKQVDGGFPASRLTMSCYINTGAAAFFTDRFVRLAVSDPTIGTPNTYYMDMVWSNGKANLPVLVFASTTGDAVGLTGEVVKDTADPNTNSFRCRFEIDMAVVQGNSNPPSPADTATFSLWIQSRTITGVNVFAWGAQVTAGTPAGEFEDYAFPAETLRTKQVVDTTFLLNRNIEVQPEFSNAAPTRDATFGTFTFTGVSGGLDETDVQVDDILLVFVRQGAVDTTYDIDIRLRKAAADQTIAVSITRGATATSDDTTAIALALATAINGDASNQTLEANNTRIIEAAAKGSVVGMKVKEDWSATEFTVDDSLANAGLIAVQDEVLSIADLPITAFPGMVVNLVGPSDTEGSSAFVRAVLRFRSEGGQANFDEGVWEEGVDYGLILSANEATMPHTLIRRQDDSLGTVTGNALSVYFEFVEFEWNDRLVGNDDTNPLPKFVSTTDEPNRTILDVGFHASRLILTSDQDMLFSEVNRYGNFFRTTTLALPDSDRISIIAASPRESQMRHVESVGGRLFGFSSQTVFILEQGDALSPKTAGLTPVIAVGADTSASPQALGGAIVYAADSGSVSTEIYGILPGPDGQVSHSRLNESLRRYVPRLPKTLTTHRALGVVYSLMDGDPTRIIVMRLRAGQGGQFVPVFSDIVSEDGTEFRSLAVVNNELFVVVDRLTGLHLEAMPIEVEPRDDSQVWSVKLDRRIDDTDLVGTRTFDAALNETTIPMPYDLSSASRMRVLRKGGTDHGVQLTINSTDTAIKGSHKILVAGDHTTTDMYIGSVYDAEVELLEPFFQTQSPGGGSFPRPVAVTVPRNISALFVDTGFVALDVSGTTDTFDAESLTEASPEDGKLRALVAQFPGDVTVKVVNNTHKPSTVVGLEWIAEVVTRGVRI